MLMPKADEADEALADVSEGAARAPRLERGYAARREAQARAGYAALAAVVPADGVDAGANARGLDGGFGGTPLAPLRWDCGPELVRLAVLPLLPPAPSEASSRQGTVGARALAAARRVAAAAGVRAGDCFFTPPDRLHVTVWANSKPSTQVEADAWQLGEEERWWRQAWVGDDDGDGDGAGPGAAAPVRLWPHSVVMTGDGTIVLLLLEQGVRVARLRLAAARRFPAAARGRQATILHVTLCRCRMAGGVLTEGGPAGRAAAVAVGAACAEESAMLASEEDGEAEAAPLELSRLRLVREEMNPNCGEFVDFVLGSAAAVERGRNAAIV